MGKLFEFRATSLLRQCSGFWDTAAAGHLLKLSWNRDLYARYFDWRGEFNLNKKKLEESENGIALGAVV